MPKALLGLILLALLSGTASAQDDRYFNSSKSYAAAKVKLVVKQRAVKRHVKVIHAPLRPHKTIWQGFRAETARAVIVAGRPARWCGWWLGRQLGMHDRKLWLASNWASVGRSARPGVGVVVVWRHHVGIITGHAGSKWIVKSGNDGHAVRERPRSITGAIAYRIL